LNNKANVSALNTVSAEVQNIMTGATAAGLANTIKDYNYNTPISIAVQGGNLYINDGNKLYYVAITAIS
jgi:hypothetical protein